MSSSQYIQGFGVYLFGKVRKKKNSRPEIKKMLCLEGFHGYVLWAMMDDELAAGGGLSEEQLCCVMVSWCVAAADISALLAEKGAASTSGLYRRALHHFNIHHDVSNVWT